MVTLLENSKTCCSTLHPGIIITHAFNMTWITSLLVH